MFIVCGDTHATFDLGKVDKFFEVISDYSNICKFSFEGCGKLLNE